MSWCATCLSRSSPGDCGDQTRTLVQHTQKIKPRSTFSSIGYYNYNNVHGDLMNLNNFAVLWLLMKQHLLFNIGRTLLVYHQIHFHQPLACQCFVFGVSELWGRCTGKQGLIGLNQFWFVVNGAVQLNTLLSHELINVVNYFIAC